MSPLKLVKTDAKTPVPPRPLGEHGLHLWSAVMAEFMIDDAGGVELLLGACQALDRAESCREQIDRDGEVIKTKTGIREHPLIKAELANRAGLRASELRGLRWVDVDIGAPKSEMGRRSVPFGGFVSNTLKEWKLACPKSELGLVFPNGEGNIDRHANIVQRGLIPIVTRALGEPKYTGLHCFRHFYASWCINRGLSPKVIQSMGHSSITITFDRYGHLFPNTDDRAEMDAAELAVVNQT